MINYIPVKYESTFCVLIGANPNYKYTKKSIFNLLIAHSKKSYKHFEFDGNLKEYLKKLHNPGWNGYSKMVLIKILNSLMTSSADDLSSKYVIISPNKSTVLVNEVNIVFDTFL
jgi:hypothetical protein